MNALRKMLAFIKKDFYIHISYRIAFLFEWISILTKVTTFYFISKLVGQGMLPYLNEYQTGYFSFVLVGIAFSGYFNTALQSFSSNIREEQLLGTLEAMLATPTKIPLIIIGISIWDFLFTTITSIICLLFGAMFFRADLSQMNLLASLLILAMTIISFSSIGIISAAFIMVVKKGNPINWMISTFSGLFGGVFFPIEMFPKKLQFISYLLPITHSLKGLRHAILQGYSFKMLMPDIMALLFFCIILFPLSIWIFKKAVNKAKLTGSLAHY